jgi:hypothetical protein
MVIYQPVLFIAFLDILRRNFLESQNTCVVRPTIWEIDEVFPKVLKLVMLPSIASLKIGNPENLLFEETVKRFRLIHGSLDSFLVSVFHLQ